MLTREAAGLQPTTKKNRRLDLAESCGLVCTTAVSFGNCPSLMKNLSCGPSAVIQRFRGAFFKEEVLSILH